MSQAVLVASTLTQKLSIELTICSGLDRTGFGLLRQVQIRIGRNEVKIFRIGWDGVSRSDAVH